jgi:predicted O-methyltransferase YrrM
MMSRELAVLNPILERILEERVVISETGESWPLHSSISVDEGLFIQDVILRIRPHFSLEIGCAYGVSSLFICQTLKDVGAERHIIIDPFQHEFWKGIGLANLDRAGFLSLIKFYSELSYRCLPRLEIEGVHLDFAFIDGQHTFDYVLVDFFYIDKMLNVGGVIIFDDINYPSIRKLCRFILRNLPYSAIGPNVSVSTGKKRIAEQVSNVNQRLGKILRSDITIPDSKIGLPSCNFVALRKNAEDRIGDGTAFNRRWDTHHRF